MYKMTCDSKINLYVISYNDMTTYMDTYSRNSLN